MSKLANVRTLLATIHKIGHHLTEDEISDIGKVLIMAMNRMEKEAGEGVLNE